MSELLKDLKMERVQGSSAVLNYSNFDYWVNWDDIVEIVEKHKQPILNENQQVVLEWLKEEIQKRDDCPFKVVHRLFTEKLHKRLPKNIYFSYLELSDEQQFQVLAAFAEWGMKEVAE